MTIPAGEPGGNGPLHRGVHGEKGIGDDLQSIEGGYAFRAGGDDPGSFHLGQAGDLAQAADNEYGHAFEAGCETGDMIGMSRNKAVVEEDFIDDKREVVFAADAGEFVRLPAPGEVAGGIVGVHEDDGAGVGRDGAAEAFGLDLPAMVVNQRSRAQADIVEDGEEIEQRIARLRDDNVAARIAQQPEQVAVRLAGAGGEDDLIGSDRDAVGTVVRAHRFAGGKEPARLRVVVEGVGVAERGEQVGGYSNPQRVGFDAVRSAMGRPASMRRRCALREVAFFSVPVRSARKLHRVGHRSRFWVTLFPRLEECGWQRNRKLILREPSGAKVL